MPQEDTSTLSIVDSSGRQVSILNHHQDIAPITSLLQPPPPPPPPPPQKQSYEQHHQDDTIMDGASATTTIRRKYVCNASGCFKSFTTSGHLARHHRIHTGEKNFPCLFPSCSSRFSRQDNMMQHYRTHMSPKSRRSKKQHADNVSHPRLHAHHRIQSDTTAPLTINQHLQNYHQTRLDHQQHQYHHHPQHRNLPPPTHPHSSPSSSSSSSVPSISTLSRHDVGTMRNMTSNGDTRANHPSPPSATVATPIKTEISPSSSSSSATAGVLASPVLLPPLQPSPNVYIDHHHPPSADIFYQHRPLKYTATTTTEYHYTHPTTLLNPTPINVKLNDTTKQNESSSSSPSTSSSSSSSSNSLVQLANIVSSFG